MSQFTVEIKRRHSIPAPGLNLPGGRPRELGFDPGRVRLAQQSWASVPLAHKRAMLRRLRHAMVTQSEVLAASSAELRDRPLAEALTAEVLPLLEACRFLERQAARVLRPRRPSLWSAPLWLGLNQTMVTREPYGIILVLAPSNYPLFLPAVQTLQALVAGNAVWIKPAPRCRRPLLLLQSLLHECGLPRDLLHVLPESTDSFPAALQSGVDKVVLTGSASTGARVLAMLAPRLVPSTMELSGCDAVFVRPDADLEMTARALVFGLRLNGGQTCIAPRRVYVAQALAADLEDRLARAFSSLPFQALDEGGTQQLHSRLTAAIHRGAHLVSGRLDSNGQVRGPVVLAESPHRPGLSEEEYFGPLLSLIAVRDEEQALFLNARHPYALGASIFSRDTSAARLLARRINAGVVVLNDMIIPTADPRIPFGGRRRSGFGATRGPEGLLEMTTPKVVTLFRARHRPHFDPLQPRDQEWIRDALKVLHGAGVWNRIAAACRLLRGLARRSRHSSQHTPTHS